MNTSPGRSLRNFELDKVKIFIKDVGLPFNRAPEALGVKSTDFMNWWAGNDPKLIKYRELISLSQFLNIDENTIIDGSYDKQFVRSVLFVDPQTLPEKYSYNQFSYMRTSAHIMKFLTLTRGQHFSDLIMRKLNISPAIYGDLNNRISLNYFVDLLEILATNGLTQSELDNLACVMFLTLSETPLGEKLKKATNYYDCYEIVANNVHLFDSNFEYTFDLDRKKIQLRSFLHFENHAHIDWDQTRVARLLRYRQILVGWFPYLSKLPPIFPEHQVEFSRFGIRATYTVNFSERTVSPLFSLPETEL